MSDLFVVVAYDVGDDRHRNKVFNTLHRYGEPVEYSVFECRITSDQLARMREELAQLAWAPEDDIRIYELCGGCARRILTLGRARSTNKPPPVFLY